MKWMKCVQPLFSWNESKGTRLKPKIFVLYRQDKWVNDLTFEKLYVNEHERLQAETVIAIFNA